MVSSHSFRVRALPKRVLEGGVQVGRVSAPVYRECSQWDDDFKKLHLDLEMILIRTPISAMVWVVCDCRGRFRSAGITDPHKGIGP